MMEVQVTLGLRPGVDEEAFLDAVIDFVESRGLFIGGGVDEFCVSAEEGDVTQQDHAAIVAFFSSHTDVRWAVVGDPEVFND